MLAFVYNCGDSWVYTKPKKFVEGKEGNYEYRVIGADGKTVIAVKAIDNPQDEITGIWATVIYQELTRKTYKLIEQKKVRTKKGFKGIYLKFKIEYSHEDYVYIIVIFEREERIYTLEFTTPEKYSKMYVPIFDRSINTFGKNNAFYRWLPNLCEAIF